MANLQNPADYMKRKMAATEEKKPVEVAKPETRPEKEPDGDEQPEALHIIISKKPEGGYKRTVDGKDGFPPDESDHESLAEAHAANAADLESKFGEDATEKAEEEIHPGLHKEVEEKLSEEKPKAKGFMSKFTEGAE